MKTSIIILTYNHFEHTRRCVDSVRNYTAGANYEVIVVDNNSTDGTKDWLREQKDIQYISNPWNYGRARSINQGIRMAEGRSILLLSSSAFVTPNWIDNLACCLYSSSFIGSVGPLSNEDSNYNIMKSPSENIQDAAGFPQGFNRCNPQKWVDKDRLSSFCIMVRREIIDEIGLLDERYFPEYYEVDDYFLRMKLAGYRVMLCMDTFIYSQRAEDADNEDKAMMDIRLMNKEKFEVKWNNKHEAIFR